MVMKNQDIYKSVDDLHGDCSERRSTLYRALSSIGLVPVDAGQGIEVGKDIQNNNCLWKSFSASSLSGRGRGRGGLISDPTSSYCSALLEVDAGVHHLEVATLSRSDDLKVGRLALTVKSDAKIAINSRPTALTPAKESVKREVRDGEQSPSDLLLYLTSTPSNYGKLCIVIFDFLTGSVEIFRGNRYNECDDERKRKHTLTMRFIAEHYQPLFPFYGNGAVRPNLEEIIDALETEDIQYLETTGI